MIIQTVKLLSRNVRNTARQKFIDISGTQRKQSALPHQISFSFQLKSFKRKHTLCNCNIAH